jgi:ribosomal protein S18 acetylase RimI-like enzyme
MSVSIRLVTPAEVPELAAMAREIWEQHYTPVIGREQVAYMVGRFQSAGAIAHQMAEEEYRYYFFEKDGERAGYMGIQPNDGLYLSKLYIRAPYRGQGIARQALEFLVELCREEGYEKIWLTVNKNNSGSIAAYEALGMTRTREQTADIGGGFVMDDYIYELAVR